MLFFIQVYEHYIQISFYDTFYKNQVTENRTRSSPALHALLICISIYLFILIQACRNTEVVSTMATR